ncbi:MAG: DNA cytosine methyltransferase [Saezia sp.]
MKYIELFAGCGGLSLGLDASGFDLFMANELSPMASETFAYNFFKEPLRSIKAPKHTIWLSSNYPLHEMENRLREDPRMFPDLKSSTSFSDLNNQTSLEKKLVIGNIKDFNKWLDTNPELVTNLQSQKIDLVAGGPPCQSFSMAGLREQKNDRNTLPLEFVNFVGKVKPKFVLLENVSGILRPFSDKKNTKKNYYAWYEVAKAFAKEGYLPLCLHINAKYVGVAQNRPRFILIGIQKEHYELIESRLNDVELKLLSSAKAFVNCKKRDLNSLKYGNLVCWDINKNASMFKGSFLNSLITFNKEFFTVKDALDDLKFSSKSQHGNKYKNHINKELKIKDGKTKKIILENHEKRRNSLLVQQRFRLYQVLNQLPKQFQNEVHSILKGQLSDLSQSTFVELSKFQFLNQEGELCYITEHEELLDLIKSVMTKKRTQKALISYEPAPAALTVPDDFCHYDENEIRTLTVREMARIQSFPDNFIFKSKVTTGGKMRKFEVPQYTQVGNAVPPLLGHALGCVIKALNFE